MHESNAPGNFLYVAYFFKTLGIFYACGLCSSCYVFFYVTFINKPHLMIFGFSGLGEGNILRWACMVLALFVVVGCSFCLLPCKI